MKKVLVILTCIGLFATIGLAQVPQAFNYQAIVRDTTGNPLPTHDIAVRVSILQDTTTGPAVYVETQNTTTNLFGLITIKIGQGFPVSGDFTGIPWQDHPYYLKIELDPEGGNTWTDMGTVQLLSVPYALHAATAENFAGDLVVDSLTVLSGITIGENTFQEFVWISPLNVPAYNMWTDGSNEPLYIQGYNTSTTQGNSFGNHTIINNEGGNVGIGTNDPQHKLDVNGYINTNKGYKIDGFNVLSVADGMAVHVGKYAGYNDVYPNSGNTFVGHMAGYSTNAYYMGNGNVAIGYYALESNIQGRENTAVGYYALANNNGQCNTALGTLSLYDNTNGELNVAVGHHALESNTSGNNNTSIGPNSGLINQTGSGNVFIGLWAGLHETNSNKLYIANNQTKSLIYGEFDNDILALNADVGIWTLNPGSELDVKGTMRLSGSTSGYVGIAPAANAGSTTYTLPTQDGSSGQVLQTDGSATLSWGAVTATDNDWTISGNDMYAAVSGNVGIGTTSPQFYKLEVIGHVHIDGLVYIDDDTRIDGADLYVNMDTYHNWGGNIEAEGKVSASAFTSNSPLIFEAPAGNERMRIDDITGYAGIGTTAPGSALDVKGTMRLSGSTSGYVGLVSAANAGSTTYTLPTQDGSNGQVLQTDGYATLSWGAVTATDNDWTISGNDMYAAVSGNVGIGTTSPNHKLEVIGEVHIDGHVYIEDFWHAEIAGNLWVHGDGTHPWDGNIEASGKVSASAFTSNSPLIFEAPATIERMRIDDITGYAGIGTTNPGSELDVKGTMRLSGSTSGYVGLAPAAAAGSTTYTLPAQDGSSGQVLQTNGSATLSWGAVTATDNDWTISGNDMYAAVPGNVGIGTTSPNHKLEVIGGVHIDGQVHIDDDTEIDGADLHVIQNGYGWGGNIFADGKVSASAFTSNSPLIFEAPAGNERMRIDDITGYAGIGTTNPGSELDVKGTMRLSGSTSGYVGLAPAAAAGSTTYTLPTQDGSNGQVLQTDGSATLSWGAVTATDNDWTISGNDMYAAVSGNVGIGTTSPSPWFKLEVIGEVRIDDDTEIDGNLWVHGGYGGNIEAATIQLHEFLFLAPRSSPPSGQLGCLYVNTNGKLYFHDGTQWKEVMLQ
ncbi:MAG: hypothetical protein NT175_00640 [Bacteroidetes bacterium]|nr:hypothetical protein [Bacteroidota bacterium]